MGTSNRGFLARLFEKILGTITGKVTAEQQIEDENKKVEIQIDDKTANYEVEYETPAPYAIEQEMSNKKIVQIVGPETIHYKDVLSFTNLPESFNVKDSSKIKIYWEENQSYIIPTLIQDIDGNGIYDYIEWLTPHLSNQTFDIIIEITKAEHLDSDRQFISDIYEQVKKLDDIWSETIPANDYVRVTFEKNLTPTNDITIYPRVISGEPTIEVYEKDKKEKIAEFANIVSNEYNKVYLTNLQGIQDTFDLRVVGGNLQLDYIVDPTYYNKTDGFSTSAIGAADPYGITTNGSDFWIVDQTDKFVYHVNRTGGNITDGFSTSAIGSDLPMEIATNNSDFWIIDYNDEFVYHTSRTGTNLTGGFSTLPLGANTPWSITTNNSDFWIIDPNDFFVYHINRTGGNITDGFSTSAIGSTSPYGITTNNSDFWITDASDLFVYHVNRTGGNIPDGFSTASFGLGSPFSMTTNVTGGGPITDFWIIDTVDDFVYHLNSLSTLNVFFISPPTPDNATSTTNTSVLINVSIVSISNSILNEITWNWNSTNYTLYNDSLVLMMNFENNSVLGENSTYFVDVSKYANNGSCTGIACPKLNTTAGRYGNAMTFDGVNDYVNISSSASLNIMNTITVEAWYYRKSNTQDSAIAYKGGAYGFFDELAGGGALKFVLFIGGQQSYTFTQPSLNNWHHIVGTYNGSVVNVYVDGIVVNTTNKAGTITTTSNNLQIGTLSNAAYFNGSIDEVRIYNRSLTANEIYELYASNLMKFNQTQWYLTVNQSGPTGKIFTGTYTYSASAKDTAGNENRTEVRTIDINNNPQINFTYPTPENATSTTNISVLINVSISESNLNEVKWNWNGTNYTIYNNSLIMIYNFENKSELGENSTYFVDVSKYANNGFCLGTNCPKLNTSGRYGNAMTFDGVDDSISAGNASYLNPTNAISVQAWIKPNSLIGTDWGSAIVTKYGGNYQGYILDLEASSGGSPKFVVCSPSSCYQAIGSFTSISINSWNHLVGVWNGTNVLIYVNGVLKNTVSAPALTNDANQPLTIGKESWYAGGYFNGTIDEVRIYNYSLSNLEVYELYASNLMKFNQTQWYLQVNQSGPTGKIVTGTYPYSASVKDSAGNENMTEVRTITINNNPSINFTNPTPTNQTSTTNTSININFSISDSNLNELKFNWNGINYTLYNDSLVFMMNFENKSELGENSTYFVDVSKYANNGFCLGTNCPKLNTTAGRYGNAMTFDGVNDLINGTNSQTLRPNYVTISAWAKTGDSKSTQFIAGYGNTGYIGYWLGADSIAGFTFSAGNGTSMIQLANPSNYNYRDNVWHHVIGTYNGSAVSIYVDGILKNQNLTAVSSSINYTGMTQFLIGNIETVNPARYWNGSIDEVRIYNRSLSSDEVYELYVSNLMKYNTTQWYLQVNQSNSTGKFLSGTYTYSASVKDIAGNENMTEVRTININNNPNINFIFPTPDNQTSTTNTSININVSIPESNLNEVKFNWNGTNYTLYNDSLLLMMNFENNSILGENSTYFVDVSKYRNNGNCTGISCPKLNTTVGRYGNAMTFDGMNDYISTAPISIQAGGKMTMSAWVYSNNFVHNGFIVSKAPVNTQWEIFFNNGNGIYLRGGGATNSVNTASHNPVYPTNSMWHHVAGTIDGTAGKIYVDGVEWASGTVDAIVNGMTSGTNDILIGLYDKTTNYPYNGSIDEVRVYNYSLSNLEIYELYASNLMKFNQTQWYLQVNQSGPTGKIVTGTYTYSASAKDTAGNYNTTEVRTIDINNNPQINFTYPTPSNATVTTNTSININFSISDSNLNELKFNWNGINYTLYNDSLVFMMNFENKSELGENSTYFVDVSKYGNNGYCSGTGCPKLNTTAGRYGNAMTFDGINDNISAGNSYSLNVSIPMTITAWVKIASYNSDANVGHVIAGSYWTQGYIFYVKGPKAQFGFRYGACDPFDPDNLTIDQWYHVVGTMNGSVIQVYVNGILKNSTSCTSATGRNTLIIGKASWSDTNYFNGSVDEIRIYNRSLSSNEVNELYMSNLQKFNQTQWYLTVNQSGLNYGTYTYSASAKDIAGNYNTTEVRTLTVPSILNCMNLNYNNTIYTLGGDIINNQITTVCINITAQNITLDCQGHYISSIQNITGIFSNQFNSTIQNCNITMGSGGNSNAYGIFLSSSNYSTLFNNTAGRDGSTGISLSSSSNNTLINNIGRSISYSAFYIFSSSNNNLLINNTGTTSAGTGFVIQDSNSNILINSTGTSNSNPGISLSSSSNNTLMSNTGTGNSSYGILLQSSPNNTLMSNTGTSNSSYGIALGGSDKNTLTNNTGTSNSNYGFYIFSSDDNILTNNIGTSNSSSGIYLSSSPNNILINNRGTSNSSSPGIGFYSSSNNNLLINNTGASDSGEGFQFSSSSNNTLINNTGTSNSGYGISLSTSSNNTLINNTGTSNTSYGIIIATNSQTNTIYNQRAIGYLGGSKGIGVLQSNNVLFQDCVNITGATDIYLTSNSINATFINCSYRTNGGNETITAGSTLIRKWYYQTYANDTSGNNVVAQVNATNRTGGFEFSINTNSSGWTNITNITEYWNVGGTRYYYSNYTITARNSSYPINPISHTYNSSLGNNLNDYFMFNSPFVLVNFISPTPDNGTSTTNNSFIANVSFSLLSLNEVKWNWNGTNYTLYNDSLVFMMNFENKSELGENSTYVKDLSKYGNNGIVSGAVINSTSGKYGWGAYFDGVNDHINTTFNPSASLGQIFTVSAWVYPIQANNYRDVAGYHGGAMQGFFFLQYESSLGGWNSGYGTGAAWSSRSVINLNLNTWTHVLVVYNAGNNITTYLNGVLANYTSVSGAISHFNNFSIGLAYSGDASRFFNGSIDEVRIYNRSLSANEVYELYASNLMKFNQTQWYLQVNQSMNFGTYTYSASVKDSAGNYNATEVRTITTSGINGCTNLTIPNSIYYLTANSSSTGTCFNVTVFNVTLDCQGYNMNYSYSGTLGYGFYSNQNFTTIRNCSVIEGNSTTSSKHAVYFVGANNGTIFNNLIKTMNSNSLPIYITSSNFNTISNNNITTNSDGIDLSSTSNINISNNNINSGGYGIWIIISNLSTISNNNITATAHGILLSTNLSTISNNRITAGTTGISLSSSSNSNISNNNINSTSYGIYLSTSSNSNVSNNNINSSSYAIMLYDNSNFNILSNNNILSSLNGIYLYTTTNSNNFSKINIRSTGAGIYIYGTNHNFTIQDSIINSSSYNQEVYISNDVRGGIWNFINVTLPNGSNIRTSWTTGGNGTLNNFWYVNVNVTNSSNNAVQNANVSSSDKNNNYRFSQLTGANGLIPTQALQEYSNQNNTLVTYYSNYTFTMGMAGYITKTQSLNMSANRLLEFTLGNNICGLLDIPNSTYILISNVNSTGTCMNVTAFNVTLDCRGYNVNYSYSGTSGYGVYSNQNLTTVRNCNIIEGNPTANAKYGVYFAGANNGTIYYNNLTSAGANTYNIYLSSSLNSNITSNNIPLGISGIYLTSGSNYSTIMSNNVNSSSVGIYLYTSPYSNITNNNVTSSSNSILLYASSYSNITNNNVTSSSNGIYLTSSSNYSTIMSNNVNSSSVGIYLDTNSNSNTIKNNNVTSSINGVYLSSSSNSNISNNNINSSNGIYLTLSFNLNISNNNINSSNCGIYLAGSTSNIFSKMNIKSTNAGIYIYNGNNNFTIQDSVINSSLGIELNISNTVTGGTWNFTNVTLGNGNAFRTNWTTGGNGTLNVFWYYRVYVNDTSGNLVVAQVNATNRTGGLEFNINSDSTGWTNITSITDYVSNGTQYYYSNYTINALNNSYPINLLNHTYNASLGNNLNDFFTFCIPTTCSALGYSCENWSDSCGGTLDCGTCSSGTCNSGICSVSGAPGGTGGVTPTLNITVIPTNINLNIIINTNKNQTIQITNNEATSKSFSITQINLNNMIILGNTSMTLAPGETKNLEVIFVAPNSAGIFTGKIIIGTTEIPVTLNVKEKLLLFDSGITVLNRNYKVSPGGELKTKVRLIPMGDKERMDIQLDYFIKDFDGKIYLTQTETVLIEDEMTLNRNFKIGDLPLGKYILGLELIYPEGKAVSSAQFEVVKQTVQDFLSSLMFTLIVAMIIVSIVIIALSIRVKMRKKIE